MKTVMALAILVVPTLSIAQDNSYITERVGHMNGRISHLLKECNAPSDTATQFKKASEQMIKNAFPDPSYQGYIEYYKKHYAIGESEAVAEYKEQKKSGLEKTLCEETINDAKKVVEAYMFSKSPKT